MLKTGGSSRFFLVAVAMTVGLAWAEAAAADQTLFDNGASSGSQTNTRNSLTQQLDFTVSQNVTVTGISWQQHDRQGINYLSTQLLIFAGLPFSGPPLYSANIVASRTPNGTGTIFSFWDGFDYSINGLSINLAPGTYSLGLNTDASDGDTSWDNTIGGPDTIPGWRVVNSNFPPPGSAQVGNLAFTLYGQIPNGGDDLVIDFGPGFGTWMLHDGDTVNGYALLHTGSPESIVTGDLDNNGIDEVILDFGAAGIWVRVNNSSWSQLHTANPTRMVTGDLDGNGQDEVIIDFPGFGIWVRRNNATWELLHPINSNYMTVGYLDSGTAADLIVDFPGVGIWINYNNDPSNWNHLHSLNSQRMAVGDFDGNGQDDIVINFTGFGLWNFANNGTWGQVHTLNATRLIAGNLDADVTGRDELIVDFGAPGIWILPNGDAGAWAFLHPGPSQALAVGDLDDNGDDDLIVDFGTFGLWEYANNATWRQLHAANPEGLAVGDINAP
jgi:hypothetical protein